jgi:hypothetical protein
MTFPNTPLLVAAACLLAACNVAQSGAGYQIRGSAVYYIDYVTPQGMNGFGGLVNERREHLIDADGKTFEILAHAEYAKDARQAFYKGKPLEGSDGSTFQLMDGGAWAKDARQVYFDGWLVPGADPATYTRVGKGVIGRDHKDYYFGSAPMKVKDVAAVKVVLPDADTASISQIWAYDRHGFYMRNEVTPLADGETFQVLGGEYAKDAKKVYFRGSVFHDADPRTFRWVGGEFATDARHAYWHDFALKDASPRTFEVLEYHYARDAKRVFHMNETIASADGPSFEVIGPSTKGFGYGRDAKRVYYAASVIEGADPSTFVVDKAQPEHAADKSFRYEYGKVVSK